MTTTVGGGLKMSKTALDALKKYPRFYLLRVTFGYGLFAEDGPHRGACFGTFYDGKTLTLYGIRNLTKQGGLAWQYQREHRRFTASPEEVKEMAVWYEGKSRKRKRTLSAHVASR